MADEPTNTPAVKPAQPTNAEIASGKKLEHGFRADGSAYPGVDPDTGERKAVTWTGLREEFGEREGARLYNDLAVTAFGGVQPGRPSLSLITAIDEKYFRTQQRGESDDDYNKARERFLTRAEKARTLMATAEAAKVKGA